MAKSLTNVSEMSFVEIGELYPDCYILVQIIEINHEKGLEIGIPLYVSNDRLELSEVGKGIDGVSMIILPGDDLIPELGGLI